MIRISCKNERFTYDMYHIVKSFLPDAEISQKVDPEQELLIEMTAEKYDLDVKLQSIGKYMLKAPMDTMSDVVTMFCKIYQYGNDIVNQ